MQKIIFIILFLSLFLKSTALAASFNIDFLNLWEAIPRTNTLDAYLKIALDKTWDFINARQVDLNTVTIGVIDTGFDSKHSEFEINNLSFGNTPLDAKIDVGIFNKDLATTTSHGTNVVGIIGANNLSATSSANYNFPHMNGVISGVTRLKHVLEIRKANLGKSNVITLWDVSRHIFDLSNSGVKIINLSLGDSVFSPLSDITFITSILAHRNILFLAAAGNNSGNAEFVMPAALGDNLDNVITVGGSTLNDNRESFSNFGSAVNISAPADAVWSPTFFAEPFDISDYEFFSGTSASAPMVTGVAAILKALEPEYQKYTPGLITNPEKIKEVLIQSADPINTGEPDKRLGTGCFNEKPIDTGCRLNAHRAVAWLFPPKAVENLRIINVTADSIALEWSLPSDFDSQSPDFDSYQIFRSTSSPVLTSTAALVAKITSTSTLTFTDTNLPSSQTFFYKVFVFDKAGLSTGSNEVSATTLSLVPVRPVLYSQELKNLGWNLYSTNWPNNIFSGTGRFHSGFTFCPSEPGELGAITMFFLGKGEAPGSHIGYLELWTANSDGASQFTTGNLLATSTPLTFIVGGSFHLTFEFASPATNFEVGQCYGLVYFAQVDGSNSAYTYFSNVDVKTGGIYHISNDQLYLDNQAGVNPQIDVYLIVYGLPEN